MKYLTWIITLPLTVAVVAFAIANFSNITIDLWPLELSLDLPLSLVVLVTFVAGVVVGGASAWLSGGKARSRARQRGYEVDSLKRENETLQRKAERAAQASTTQAVIANNNSPGTKAVTGGA